MAVPAAAAAAAAATLAYLNAKWRLSLDYNSAIVFAKVLGSFIPNREKQDRLNGFYLVEENAQKKNIADKVFLIYEDKRWTFREFYDSVLRYAGWLHSAHKVTQGGVVAIDFMNCPEMLMLITAIWSLGALPALINYNLTGESMAHSIRTSGASLLIIESEVAENILTSETKTKLSSLTFRNNSLPLKTIVFDRNLQISIEYFKPYRAPDSARSGATGRDPSLLISTSGTTGLPKQAKASWLRVIGGAYTGAQYCSTQPVTARKPDVLYSAMPLYHGTGFFLGFGMCIVSSTTFALSRRFSVSKFWPEVKRYNVTGIVYVGEVLRYLIAAPANPKGDKDHQVRFAIGNGLRLDVWKKFKARFDIETIIEFYASTESTFALFNISRNDFGDGAIGQYGKIFSLFLSRMLSVVKVDWEREVPLRDPSTGFCAKVASGDPGEMIAKIDASDPEARFQGYQNNEKASREKILRDVFVKGDAYFRSGDVMRWNSDGRIWFLDRIGDTFRWKSENVSTMEVSEVIGHHPEVLEANVYGVSVPGHEGRAGCAALLLRDSALEEGKGGTTVKTDVLKSLATHSRKSLQKVSIPVFLRVVTEMATTGNNKSIKHVLRNQGVNLQAIQDAGSGDRLYWLQPGAERYVEFEAEHQTALNSGKARL